MSVEGIEPDHDGHGLRIGVVQSRFNGAIVDALAQNCIEALLGLGVATEDILLASVPGALEIPVALQKMAVSEQFDALIALGAVIRGETYHFELVANESGAGVTRVALDTGLPIANGILTTDTEEQARARVADKGRDAARVAVEMANLVAVLEDLRSDDALEDDGGLD